MSHAGPAGSSDVAAAMAVDLCTVAPTLAARATDRSSLFAVAFAARSGLNRDEGAAVGAMFNAMYGDAQRRHQLMNVVFPVLPRDERGPEHWGVLQPAVVDAVVKARRLTADGEFIVRIAAGNTLAYEAVKADMDDGGVLGYLALSALARRIDDTPSDPRVPDLLQRLEAGCAEGGSTKVAVATGFIEDLEPRWLDPFTRPVPFPPLLSAAALF